MKDPYANTWLVLFALLFLALPWVATTGCFDADNPVGVEKADKETSKIISGKSWAKVTRGQFRGVTTQKPVITLTMGEIWTFKKSGDYSYHVSILDGQDQEKILSVVSDVERVLHWEHGQWEVKGGRLLRYRIGGTTTSNGTGEKREMPPHHWTLPIGAYDVGGKLGMWVTSTDNYFWPYDHEDFDRLLAEGPF